MPGRYGLEIRSATASDAPGLAELIKSAGVTIEARAVAERIDALRQEPGALLVALEWGPPSGVVAVSWRRSLLTDTPTAQITTLLVAPESRRRGVARLLLKAAARVARTAGCASLRINSSRDHADLANFCLSTGFTEAGAVFERSLRKHS